VYGDVHATYSYNDDLVVLSYSSEAGRKNRWNFLETVSRGLIINFVTGEVVARPFDKFFGYFEGGRKPKGHLVAVTEKIDGSMGTLYRSNGQYAVSTRNSFDGEQAMWATRFLNSNYDLTGLPQELTLIFEIVYPENRVIIDYGERQDLVLIGARNRFSGKHLCLYPSLLELATQHGFTTPRVYAFNSSTELLAATGTLPETQEGYVATYSDDSFFKFKGDRYLEIAKGLVSY
jgi:RNA ligase